MRVVFLPSHLPSPLSLTPTILPAGRHPACHGDSMGVKEAAVYRAYSYAALSVQLCCTIGATMLHTWCQIAALFWHHFSVSFMLDYQYDLCCTIGIPMLYYQYTYAGPLVPECFTLLVPFFQFVYKQYQGELRVHSSFYYSKTYP